MSDSTATITNGGFEVAASASDVVENSALVDDNNDLHMIDLCKDIMIHERDKNSAYTRVLTEQIVFLKSELSRKQTTIETLLKLLMQKDQSSSEDIDATAAAIQEIIRNSETCQDKDLYSHNMNKSDKACAGGPTYHPDPPQRGRPKDASSTRMEYIESIGSSVLKQQRDGDLTGRKQQQGKRGMRYGYKLISSDIGDF